MGDRKEKDKRVGHDGVFHISKIASKEGKTEQSRLESGMKEKCQIK